ncbi:hypothetical protein [uncultured Rothia sp.]|uniref:hypothetical protein n=1 Tax=uncultured Rothia sp. TaxID=316088 RepID=UPI003217097C
MPQSSKNIDVSPARSGWKSLRSSTQMFLIALGIQLFALIASAVAVFGTLSTPDATLRLFLFSVVLSIVASALVMLLCLVGLFRYRRMTVWNIFLLVFSLATNPVLIITFVATAL